MNKSILNFAKQEIKKYLHQCSEPQQMIFKRMYSYNNLTLPIDEVVDNMPDEKLDWALTQVQNTLKNQIKLHSLHLEHLKETKNE